MSKKTAGHNGGITAQPHFNQRAAEIQKYGTVSHALPLELEEPVRLEMTEHLNQLLAAHARGEDTEDQFRDFMDKHGDFFPDDPQDVEELIDSLTLAMNRARQAEITQEILEVVAGADALTG